MSLFVHDIVELACFVGGFGVNLGNLSANYFQLCLGHDGATAPVSGKKLTGLVLPVILVHLRGFPMVRALETYSFSVIVGHELKDN